MSAPVLTVRVGDDGDDNAPESREVVEQTGYDRWAYSSAREVVEELVTTEAAFSEKGWDGEAVTADLHASLWKAEPTIRDGANAAHRALIEETMRTTEYQSLREYTTMNDAAAALAAAELGERIAAQAQERREPKPGEPGDPLALGSAKPGDKDAMRRAMRGLVREARQATEQALTDADSLGWGEGSGTSDGRTRMESVREASKHAKRSARLRAILDMAGRMTALALRKHETRPIHGPDELHGVEVGGSLERALPAELALLRHPVLRRDFLRRLTEGRVLQYRIEASEPEGRGPVVIAIDCSGSMQGAREYWAKGIALGLLAIAMKEKRDFAIVLFSDAVKQWSFTAGPPTMDKLCEALEAFDGLGTNFKGALDASLKLCEGSKLDKADVIFLTDGECKPEPTWEAEWLARKRAKGARLWGVTIGTQARSLDQLADGVAAVSDLRQDAEAVDLVFGF